jgi:serine/threonine protein kinase
VSSIRPGSPVSAPIGQVLLGRYRVVRELAKGGMGVVYLARAEGAVGFVKPVVIKLVLPEHAADDRFRNMFVREARILANLRHPGIVDVLELGEEDGAYVMVLEYVRGYHVGQWSKYLRLKQRDLPADIAIQIVVDVLDALHHAHAMAHPDGTSMHIVHRDVSPSNILLDEDGRARLLDFGVARMRGGSAEYLTQVKGFVGKLIYSAPEVFAEGGEATPCSDAYSCAVVLHELLLGRNTFRADSQGKTLHRVLHHEPENLESLRADLPMGLDAILKKALSKIPADRYTTARELALALKSLQTEPESELRTKLADMLKSDFSREMSELLGLESLADRDEAWRRLNHRTQGDDAAERISLSDAVLAEFYPTNISSTGNSGSQEPVATPRKPSTPPTAAPTTAPRRSPSSKAVRLSAIPPPPPSSLGRQALVPTERIPAPRSIDPRSSLIAGAAVLIGALGSYLWLDTRAQVSAAPAAESTAQLPPVRVTDDAAPLGAQPADEQGAISEPLPEVEPSTGSATKKGGRRTTRGGRAERGGPDARALSAAFSAQRPRIEACFKAHTVTVQGVATLSLAFTIDAAGQVMRASLAPPGLASTALGQCLASVGKATSFPATGRELSFSIPLSARSR